MNKYTQKIKKLQKEINTLKHERNAEIAKMKDSGKTLREIGFIFDISNEAVRKIINKINIVDKK